MSKENRVVDYGGNDDLYSIIVSALEKKLMSLDSVTVKDLAPVDQFHARGFPATVELGDRLSIKANHHILDIGCGLGGPARYFAERFQCKVSGVDITKQYVETANKLTQLLGLNDLVFIEHGDGQQLPYENGMFDGAYSQHVTMNVENRLQFFKEALRVLKPGAFFAFTDQGLGPAGNPHHPLPWSEDGSGAYLVSPAETISLLEEVGFEKIIVEDTGAKYLEGYNRALELSAKGPPPPLGLHILMGENTNQKIQNAARNIEEGRTHPVRLFCNKPA